MGIARLKYLLALLAFAGTAHAACSGSGASYSCTAGSTPTDVQGAITAVSSGGTVTLASGAYNWSSGVSITKAMTLTGAGPSSTVINASNATVIVINTPSAMNVRVTQMGFTGTGASTQLETTLINVRGWIEYVRLDNLKFTDIQQHAVYVGLWDTILTSPKMLIDHIDYSSSLSTGFQRFIKILGVNSTWASPDNYGTNNFVFIEDSSFVWTGTANTNSGVTDTEHGVRMVVRYNTISGGGVQTHDTGSTDAARGQRATEVYNNTFSCPISGCGSIPAIGVRGGGWLIYNNVIATNYWVPALPQIYRATVGPGYLGQMCNGTPLPACNTTGYYHCSGGDHRTCGYASDGLCAGLGMGTCVTAAASSANCNTPTDAWIANLDRVNGGSDVNGWPCRDQSGWGQEVAGVGTPQSPSPVYWSGNTTNGVTPITASMDITNYFLVNRDYCNATPGTACGAKTTWTYTAYTYPYPWPPGTGTGPTNFRYLPIRFDLDIKASPFTLALLNKDGLKCLSA